MSGAATIPVWNWSALAYLSIVVLRGTEPYGLRRKLSPDIVADLVNRGGRVHMRSDAGDAVSFPDTVFSDVAFVATRAALVADADVVMASQPPAPDMVDDMKEGAILMCSRSARHDHVLIQHLLDKRITCFAVESMPAGAVGRALYGRSQTHLLASMRKGNVIALDWTDEALARTVLTHAGQRMGGPSTISRESGEPYDSCRQVPSALVFIAA